MHGVNSKTELKNSLHVDKTNLWTVKNFPSHDKVASVNVVCKNKKQQLTNFYGASVAPYVQDLAT